MNDELNKIIEKVRRLNSLASNNPNPNEAANAAAAAAKLIAEYQIAEADLIVKGEVVGEAIIIDKSSSFKSGRRMLWIDTLAMVLVNHFGCDMYWNKVVVGHNSRGYQTESSPVIIGRKSDVEVVHYFFDWLHPLIANMAKQQASGRGLTYSQNYLLGVVRGIEVQFERLRAEEKRKAQQENRVQAMVLLDNRKALATDHLNSTGIKLVSGPGSKLRGSDEAHAAGKRDGEKINLTKGLNGSKGPNQLS